MADPAQHRATYADLEAVPPEFTAEIISGQLVCSPRGLRPKHSAALACLGGILGNALDGEEVSDLRWILASRPEIHAQGDILVPSIAGWQGKQLGDPDGSWAEVPCPDFVCEMSSPSLCGAELQSRLASYASAGVPFVWHIDLAEMCLDTFKLDGGEFARTGQYDSISPITAAPFEAVGFSLIQLAPFHNHTSSDQRR